MNEAIKKLWVQALRSGEYQQGTGQLLEDGRYCCLGVLCDIHAKTTQAGEFAGEGYHAGGEVQGLGLLRAVKEWAGLSTHHPEVGAHSLRADQIERGGWKRRGHVTFAELNDAGLTFPEIADLIEKAL